MEILLVKKKMIAGKEVLNIRIKYKIILWKL